MAESRVLTVPRSARVHWLGDPRAASEAWFVLHGYGQLGGAFLAAFECVAAPERLIVAPEALSRFYLRRGTGEVGASWMTKEARADEIADTVRYLDLVASELVAARPEVALHVLGFSQGGAAAARWSVLGRTDVARVTLFAAGLPPDLDLGAPATRARAARWTLAFGERDGTLERGALQGDVARLETAGITAELLPFAGGHELHEPTLLRLAEPG